eukprot:8502833-Pyramimonas_sp.AAC.1
MIAGHQPQEDRGGFALQGNPRLIADMAELVWRMRSTAPCQRRRTPRKRATTTMTSTTRAH